MHTIRQPAVRLLVVFLFIITACAEQKDELYEIWLPDDIAVSTENTEADKQIYVALPYYQEVLTGPVQFVSPAVVYAAKKKFMDDFPGWSVTYLIEGGRFDDKVWIRYYDELPGRLTDENAPDVILLEGTNFKRMVRDESLLDIRVFFEGDVSFNDERYIPWFLMDNGDPNNRFKLPVSFSVPIFYLNTGFRHGSVSKPDQTSSKEIWTWDEMVTLFNGERIKARQGVIFSHSPDDMTRHLLENYHDVFYDYTTGAYNFNVPVFVDILTNVKKVYKDGFTWATDEPIRRQYNDTQSDEKDENGMSIVLYEENNAYGLVSFDFMQNESMDYSNFVMTVGTRYPLPQMGGIEGIALKPEQEFAINRHSPHPEMAWEFLKILLSDEVQQGYNEHYAPLQMGIDYIPVISKLDGRAVKQAKTAFRGQSDEQIATYNADRNLFYQRADRVYGWNSDLKILGKVIEYAVEFYKDEITLEDVIIYLHE